MTYIQTGNSHCKQPLSQYRGPFMNQNPLPPSENCKQGVAPPAPRDLLGPDQASDALPERMHMMARGIENYPRLSFNSLRHTYVPKLAMVSSRITGWRRFAGHRSKNASQFYSRARKDMLLAALRAKRSALQAGLLQQGSRGATRRNWKRQK